MTRAKEGGGETQAIIRTGDGFKLRSRKIRVELCDGPERGRSVELAGPEVRIGSGRGCDLVLKDKTTSRHHLTLRIEGDDVRVIDADSRNGTVLDGVRVRDAFARPDSTIKLGSTTLRLDLLDATIDLPLSENRSFGGLLGESTAMRRVFSILERIAPTDSTVLVEGESGTGKELVAEGIHEASPRSSGPFVVFDCSAVSANLIESSLFGHVRGAFTGAVAERAGAFEAANGGTLFLDEIGELPIELQPKLLRALEQREVRRVGSNVATRVDVRIVAATNRSLAAEVDRGQFREDLFYRLAVIHVSMPPLRERPDDIPLLVAHFCQRSTHTTAQPLSERTIETMAAQTWPGNVRELRNAVARALSLGTVSGSRSAGAQQGNPRPARGMDLSVPLKEGRDRIAEDFERDYLRAALEETGGNVTRAAELAGVNRKFIQRAMKKYDLRTDD